MSHSCRRHAAKVALVAAALACVATSPADRDRPSHLEVSRTGSLALTAELPRHPRILVRLSTNEGVTAGQVDGFLQLQLDARSSGTSEASADAGTSPGRSVHVVLRGADGTPRDESVMTLDRSSVIAALGAEALKGCSGTACEDSFSSRLDPGATRLELELVE